MKDRDALAGWMQHRFHNEPTGDVENLLTPGGFLQLIIVGQ